MVRGEVRCGLATGGGNTFSYIHNNAAHTQTYATQTLQAINVVENKLADSGKTS